jgi:hypothetical protein
MNMESVFVKAVCAFSFSLASAWYATNGDGAMAALTGMSASVAAILFVREILK